MKITLQNIGPIRDKQTFEFEGISAILGDNGLGKTTLTDSIGILLYGAFNNKKNTKKYFELNDDLDESFVEIEGLKICGKNFGKIRREIIKSGKSTFKYKLFIDGEIVDNNYFEKLITLDEYLLMTDYSFFSKLTGDEKIIMLNSFFDLDIKEIFNLIISNEIDNIEKLINDNNFKILEKLIVDIKTIKTLFVSNFDKYNIDINNIQGLTLDRIKELSLISNRELNKISIQINELFKIIQGIPKNELTGDNKETLIKKHIEIKNKKENNLKNINIIKTFEKLNNLYLKIKEILDSGVNNIDFNNKTFKNENNIIIDNNLLFSIEEYIKFKNNLENLKLDIKEKILNGQFSNIIDKNKQIEILNQIKENKIKDLINNINELILNNDEYINKYINNEKLNNNKLLNELYEGKIIFGRKDNNGIFKELNINEQQEILNFIRSKFINENLLVEINNKKINNKILNELVLKISNEYKNILNIINNSLLKNFDKQTFENISGKLELYKNNMNFIIENRLEYLNITNELSLGNLEEVSKFLNEQKIKLGFNNKESLEKERELLDKEEFDIVGKIKNLEKNEETTNRFLNLTNQYNSLLKEKRELEVFNFIMKKFIDYVLINNYDKLNNEIIKISDGILKLKDSDKKDNIQIVYVNKIGQKTIEIPYQNMSEGIKTLTDNILMNVIYKLFQEKGKDINFFLIDEISSISENNRKILFNLINKDKINLLTFTTNNSLEILNNLKNNELINISHKNIFENKKKKLKNI